MWAHPEQADADHPCAAALIDADLSMLPLLEVALLGIVLALPFAGEA
jgi:hypothetical protein